MRIRFIVLLVFLLYGKQILQAQETAKTLLWRITGNSFIGPCYLYGTMHTSDKRVYYLGDSVYSCINFCNGFAMEIDPGDDIDTLINSLQNKDLNIAYKEAVENSLVKKDAGYYKRMQWEFDSIYSKLRERYNDLSSRDIARLRKAYKLRDKNDMNTTFDLYLYDLAKTQGKIVGGIEDIGGRAALLDEFGNSFDPDMFLKNQRKKYIDVHEWMIENYTAAELDKLEEFSKLGQTARQISIILYQRNDIMARRIDSLGRIRTTFCAVGSAHLPGDSGLISLLRKKGFTVEPVFSSKKIEPGTYKFTRQLNSMLNISDPDSNYVVQMPGKPTGLTSITDKIFVKTYKELSNEIMLMAGAYEDGYMNKTIDKELYEMKYFFSQHDIKIYSTNKINRHGLDGYELNFKREDGYFTTHMFYSNGKTYLFAIGSKNRDSLQAARCKNYLATYIINLDKQQAESKSFSFTSNDKAFAVTLPETPKKETINGAVTYTKEDVTLFSSVDVRKKISYLVLLKEPFKGYYHDFDSTIFYQTIKELLKDVVVLSDSKETVMLDNLPALKFKISARADDKRYVIYSVMTIRDNRFYNITVRSLALPGNELIFDQFINSFRFLPYQPQAFEERYGANRIFSVSSPSQINVLTNKSGRNNNRTDYYAYDSATAMSYGITALGLSKYYWANERTSLLNEYARFNFNDSLAVNNVLGSDSLLYKKIVFNGEIEGREILVKTISGNTYSRIRVMQHGDSVFMLNIKADKEFVTNSNADIFFNSFRFTNEKINSTAFLPKTDILIKDLQSVDSTNYKPALEALQNGFRFPQQDLHKILAALQYNYAPAIKSKANLQILLSKKLAGYAGDELFDFINNNYPLWKNKREDLKLIMLNVLSACDSERAYNLLKGFLLNDPSAEADYEEMLANACKLPARAASLFPDLLIKLKDDKLSPVIIDLANTLIDSKNIQYSSVSAYEDDLVRAGKKLLLSYRENYSETFNPPHAFAIINMLAKSNNKAPRSVLKDLLDLQIYNLAAMVIQATVKNDRAVSGDIFDWFCKDPLRRISMYDDLLKVNRQSYFKGEYANQKSFADAFTEIYTKDEIRGDIPIFYELVTIKDALIKNTYARFYIYKVTCQFRRGSEIYTSMVGSFSTDPSFLSIKEGKEFYILNRKPFSSVNIDALFSDFIEQIRQMK